MEAATPLDHVALWVDDPDTAARFFTGCCGMHVVTRGDGFVLVGSDARRGKLTLFAGEGQRALGHLGRIDLGVKDIGAALERLPADTSIERRSSDLACFKGPDGIPLGFASRRGMVEYDLHTLTLRVGDPRSTFADLLRLGLQSREDTLYAGDVPVLLESASTEADGPSVLNHIALRVDSVDARIADAREKGLAIIEVVDAANTRALFLWGPERIKVELVEHKPTFSLV